MNSLFAKKSNSVIGLDIGTYSIKAVQVSRVDGLTKLDGYSTIINESIKLDEPKLFSQIISNLLGKPSYGKFDAKKVIINLPKNYVKSHIIIRPAVKYSRSAELDTIIKQFAHEQRITEPIHVDYQIVGSNHNDTNTEMLTYSVSAIPTTIADSIEQSLKQNHLEFGGLSSLLSATHNTSLSSKHIGHFIEIGHNDSTYIFYSNNICIVKNLAFGSNKIVAQISRDLGISEPESIKLLNTYGLYGNEYANRLRHIIEKSMAVFCDELASTVREYNKSFTNIDSTKQSELIISGHIAATPGFAEFLTNKLQLPVSVIKPWQNTNTYPLKPMPAHRIPQYATAIGLALA